MEIYLVGGAVRDRLLGKAVQDRDWVVVGATPDEMLAQGFKQVGADFPVFLHPGSREEYALARTERKQGRGYHGFTVYSAPDVTLEDDLRRRDLTVNAMAQAEDGTLIDPFDGQRDLERRLLRHVSPAFSEDPLRILRVARFAARLAPLGFEVAEETLTLMTDMVASGEADHLVPERTWQETRRALHEQSPRVYFEVLRRCGALAVIIPELDRLFDGLQPLANEADDGELALRALTRASALSDETCVRFAALTHALGPESGLSEAAANRKKSRTPIQALCERLKVPNDCRDLALAASAHHAVADQALSLAPAAVLQLLDNLDAWRRPQRFEQFLLACEAIAQARIPPGSADFQSAYPQADSLRDALRAAQTVEAREFLDRGVIGKALGKAIREARLQRIEDRLRGQAPS